MRAPLVAAIAVAALPVFVSAQAVAVAGRIADRPDSATREARPAPRLSDGHPDLGNGKGSWNPRVLANLSGEGDPRRSPVEKIIDVPFQPWARGVFEVRQQNLQLHDPESKCLPPGIPRMKYSKRSGEGAVGMSSHESTG